MYVHLGRDYVLNDRDIIGIFNLETTTISPRGREFLNYAQKNGAVVSLSDELPQSYVLADSPVDTIYLSELSPAALKRRTETTVADLDSRVLQFPKYRALLVRRGPARYASGSLIRRAGKADRL